MGWHSHALISILVFGILFSLIYISDSKIIATFNEKAALIRDLQSASRADAYISRMINPENICPKVDQETLEKYPALLQGINEADELAEHRPRPGINDGNYYSGVGLYLNKTQMLSLIESHEGFKLTEGHESTANNIFTHTVQNFSCGFSYLQNYYRIDLSFETLEQVNRAMGYVPVHITNALVEKNGDLRAPSGTTFAPFNNTLVFFNDISSTVTIEVSSKDAIGLEPLIIPPGKMSDLRLAAGWSNPEDAIYHYKLVEYPLLAGDFSVSKRYTYGCLSNEIAKSIYAQSDFEIMFPSYLPGGFKLACNAESTDSYLIQIYVNQSAVDYYRNSGIEHPGFTPYLFYLDNGTPDEEAKGIFQVHALKFYTGNTREQLQDRYYYYLNQTTGFATRPEFFETNEALYLTYYQGKISTVEVAKSDELYRLVGTLPMDEMTRIAKSLS